MKWTASVVALLDNSSHAETSFTLHADDKARVPRALVLVGSPSLPCTLRALRVEGPGSGVYLVDLMVGSHRAHSWYSERTKLEVGGVAFVSAARCEAYERVELRCVSADPATLIETEEERELFCRVYGATVAQRMLHGRDSRGELGSGAWNDPMAFGEDVARIAVLRARRLAGVGIECASVGPQGQRCARGAFHRPPHSVRSGPYMKESSYGQPPPGQPDAVAREWLDDGGEP